MAKINILDSKIYNKIAAGEVVERPASIVKELLDNSIDAGADDIKIEIKGGGLKSITVKDNGCGIDREDVKTAFLAHATSKITSEKDLFGIKTLGFRGEALASIAAVSMVNIKTMTNGSLSGITLSLKGGEVTEESDCGISCGTAVTVDNLFYNTPARLKFLKSDRAEESEITNIVSRYILANPDIRIKFTSNDKLIYQSAGNGLKEALNSIYGKDVLNNIIEIDREDNGFKLYGYIGKPSYTKANRTYQTLAVNKRYVINTTISAAITNAYGDFLMKRQYPFYMLHFNVPDDFIDVNVHPNKLDVRFEDNKRVFNLLYQPIYGKLHNISQNITVNTENRTDIQKNDVITQNNTMRSTMQSTVQGKTRDYITDILNKYDNHSREINLSSIAVKDIYDKDIENIYKQNNAENGSITENKGIEKSFNDNVFEQKNFENICFDVKCVLFNTFIVIETSDNILLIDQHAAHERLLYDNFYKSAFKGETAVQDLLVPYLVNVNAIEFDFLYGNIKPLNEMGFCIEIFGNSVFKVSCVPAIFSDIDLTKFFNDILKDLNNLKQIHTEDLLKETLIKKACHAAVKAGDTLDRSEIDIILKKLFDNTVLLCPHGRPIVIKYSKYDIEKLFKRIV